MTEPTTEPTVTATRTVAAPPEHVYRLVSDGKHLTGVDDRGAHTRTMLETTLTRLKAAAEQGTR